jgi:hypothetical protein
MDYEKIARAFKELAYRANGLRLESSEAGETFTWVGDGLPQKWKSLKELEVYFEGVGGKVTPYAEKREGYLVVNISEDEWMPQVLEVPMEFAMKVLTLGGFP